MGDEETRHECKFCGGPEATLRRHAVPTWFLEEVQADTGVISSFSIFDVAGLRAGHFHFPDVVEKTHENITDYWVCEGCGYGWIEEMNRRARGPMTTLLREKVSDIDSVMRFLPWLRENAGVLVKSAFEVVLACDFVVESSTIPEEHYKSLYQGSLPEGAFVELGFCSEPSEFRILSGPLDNDPANISSCTYRVGFQAGTILMMVRHVTGVPYDPYPGNVLLHPEVAIGEELDIFHNAIEIIAWDILAMEYFNEKTKARKGTFIGLYEEDSP